MTREGILILRSEGARSQLLNRQDVRDRLIALIDDLPQQCGRVVRLRKIDGRSPSEIAVLLGISVSTVEKHLAKGLELIVTGLREQPAAQVVKSAEWIRRRTRK